MSDRPADPLTIEIAHSGWERLGSAAGDGRDRNRHGWATLLPHFTTAVRRGPPPAGPRTFGSTDHCRRSGIVDE